MKKLLFLVLFGLFLNAEVDFAEPKPSFENPRKWLIMINSSEKQKVNHTINAVNNVLKGYPEEESLYVEIVFYANGIRALRKDYDNEILKRIKSLMIYDNINFVVCKNTMDTMGWEKSDFIDGVDYVQIGIAEVLERVAKGWINVTPY